MPQVENHDPLAQMFQIALVAQQAKDWQTAIDHYQQMLVINPCIPEVYYNLAQVYAEQENFAQAIQCYQQAIHYQPQYGEAYNNLGSIYQNQGKLPEAIAYYQKALTFLPASADIHYNLGTVYHDLGELERAIASYENALAIKPNDPVTHKNYSISLLLAGNFNKGWQEYEWRWQSGELTPRNYQQPVWDGQPLQGKTLLVYWEQGLGDTLQFVRYLSFINKNDGKIILECQEPLFRLLENSAHIDQLIKYGENIPEFDLHIPLMSLPRVMGTNSLAQIPAQTPYLTVPSDSLEKLPLPAGNQIARLKIGLVWGVNHAHPKSHKRSCPLEYLLPLTQIPVIQLYSLQVGPQVADLTNFGEKIVNPIIDLSNLITDFADTAVLIEQLDFVITVDTAVAHLAGALGKPVWLIVPFVPDWRWLLNEEIAVWYPTMRIFRQTEAGNWGSAVNQLIQVLLSIINQQPKIQPQTNQYFNKGLEKQNAGDLLTAVNFYQRAIAYQPSYASTYSNLGNAFMGLQKPTVAIAHFQRAIKLKPDLIQAYINLGAAYQAEKDYERAIATYQQAIEINPEFAITYNNLACLHLICNNIQEAKFYSERAIALDPSLPDPYTNLGSVLLELGEIEEALANYQHALSIKPDLADARKNLAMTLLLKGELKEGFAEYEWRWQTAEFSTKVRKFPQPAWDGSNIKGKTLLVHDEQGLGDNIQFARYGEILAEQGVNVILGTRLPLKTIFQTIPGVKQVVTQDDQMSPADYYASVLSLPHLCGTTLETIPANIPYIFPVANNLVQIPVIADKPFKVGIVWGSKSTNSSSAKRSCQLADFANLAKIPGVQLYSLQKGEQTADLENIDWVINLDELIDTFADTANIISQLDLVITVDTSVAHLAGAMGKPVWILLPFSPDWRWMLPNPSLSQDKDKLHGYREYSPWYPTMRLFRQTKFNPENQWSEVFRRVERALQTLWETPGKIERQYSGQAKNAFEAGQKANRRGDLREAIQQYKRVISLQPDFFPAYHVLGDIYRKQANWSEAIHYYQRAIAMKPNGGEIYHNLGNSFVCLEKWQTAIGYYQQAIRFHANSGTVESIYRNLAKALYCDHNYQECLTICHTAISLYPNSGPLYHQLSLTLLTLGQYSEGMQAAENLIKIDKNSVGSGYHLLAAGAMELGQVQQAIKYYQKALAIAPREPEIKKNLGLALLSLGDFAEGWKNYEARLLMPDWQRKVINILNINISEKPRWDGCDLTNKTLYIIHEQGLGDNIQFIRYVQLLVKDHHGIKIIVSVTQSLKAIFANISGIDQVISENDQLPDFDYYIPLISLPYMLATRLDNIPADVPYITALTNHYVPIPLIPDKPWKIGIVWGSKSSHFTANKRSCQLTDFANLAKIPQVQLYSLQKGPQTADLANNSPINWVINLDPLINDFSDTASIINQLDLVITVDTAIAHFVGAMGKTVWLLLPVGADWRWLDANTLPTYQEYSPWYPTMRLFRQTQAQDWSDVFTRVEECLREFSASTKKVLSPLELSTLAQEYQQQGNTAEAIAHYQQAIISDPNYIIAYNNLGNLYKNCGQIEQAIAFLQKAVQLQPAMPEIHSNLASAYQDQGDFVKAISHFQRAIALKPDNIIYRQNLATVLHNSGQIADSIEMYRSIIQLDPNNAEMHRLLGMNLLLMGDFAEGFAEYEWRWQTEKTQSQTQLFEQPQWDGENPAGKKILLFCEQGFGDSMQFIRYAQVLIAEKAQVLIATYPELKRLFETIPGVQGVYQTGDVITDFQYNAPLMSLPRLCSTNIDHIPADIPYLFVTDSNIILPPAKEEKSLKIGIVWGAKATHATTGKRSCQLTDFADLAKIPGVQLYSLQKGEQVKDLQNAKHGIDWVINLDDLIHDFADSANIIQQLDLVISVDTAIAHLAGAMGKQVWLLLTYVPDWRWFLQRQDSPWYPTMRLFRQKSVGDWASVFTEVQAALTSIINLTQSEQVKYFDQYIDQNIQNIQQTALSQSPQTMQVVPRISAPRIFNNINSANNVNSINQKSAENLFKIANEHLTKGDQELAITAYTQAIQANSKFLPAYYELAKTLKSMGRYPQALQVYQQSLALYTEHPDVYLNMANIYKELGEYTMAIANYQKSLQLQPDHALSHHNLALTFLLLGNFAQGWQEYEWRWQKLDINIHDVFPFPLWQGEYLAGKTILLHSEQGWGDSIQFIRYVPLLANMGATVLLATHPPLTRLFTQIPGLSQIFLLDGDLPNCDFHAPLMSLPRWLETGTNPHVNNIPNCTPYLFATTPAPMQLVSETNTDHQNINNPVKVGIVWGAKAGHGTANMRSCDLSDFQTLTNIPQVQLYSLQKGLQVDDLANAPNIINLDHYIEDFADTASMIAQLDLVITVDTAVAHLAGAMGKETWVLLPFNPDWRWLLHRSDSPWYPTMRLFRQKSSGNWQSVFTEVKVALENFVKDFTHDHFSPAFFAKLWGDQGPVVKPLSTTPATPFNIAVQQVSEQVVSLNIVSNNLENTLSNNVFNNLSPLPGEPIPTENKTDLANYYFNLAYQQSEAGNITAAISQYQRAIAEKPDYGQAYYNLGTLYQQQGNIDQALTYCDIAIQLLPKELGAICAFSLADTLVKNQRELQAINYYRQAICLNPQMDNAYYSLGKTYKQLDLLENGIICYQKLIAKQPDYAEAYVMLGNLNKMLGLQQRAIGYFDQAISLKPDLAETHNNLSLSLLLVGDYTKGWQEYEWRWQTPQGRKLANFTLWQGEELQGANILIQTEQGLGDSLQFIRYIPLVVARGGRVILECQKPLKRLFSKFPGISEIYGQGENLPPVKVQIPLLSLPRIFQTRLDNIPADIPYLYPPADVKITLPKIATPSYKIGIVWASNPKNATSRYRCCHLNYFRELTNITGVQLYSLQKDQAVKDLQTDDLIINLDHLINDFADTAAIIAQLDLIITVDTAVAHLAGAMGKKVWMLLPFNPDWRWLDPNSLNQSEDNINNTINSINYQEYTPWYPTMRLFRQPRRHDWSKVFQQIKQALGELLATADNISDHVNNIINNLNNIKIPATVTVNQSVNQTVNQAEKVNQSVNDELVEILNQAYNLRQANQAPEAIALLETTLVKIQATTSAGTAVATIYYHLGNTYLSVNDPVTASNYYEKLLKLPLPANIQPSYVHNNLGIAYRNQTKLAEAIAHFRRAISLNPDDSNAHNNLGSALQENQQISEAIPVLRRAIALDPTNAAAHENLGMGLLALENYPEGWQKLEYRYQAGGSQAGKLDHFTQPAWDGTSLVGKSIFIFPEQGFGDMIQFLRYVPLMAELGSATTKILLGCYPQQAKLFTYCCQTYLSRCQWQVVVEYQAAFNCDFYTTYINLPLVLKDHIGWQIPGNIPYISIPPTVTLPTIPVTDHHHLKVGIVWASSATNSNYSKKSCSLNNFVDLINLPGVSWYSLQFGTDAQQIQELSNYPQQIHDCSNLINDFADTATIIQQLDLIITVDTAVAHLAGAMGKTVWVLIPFAPDWRWQLYRSDSPWYPTMRLFRQNKLGDWQPVFAALQTALTRLIQSTDQLGANQLGAIMHQSAVESELSVEQLFNTACQYYANGEYAEAIAHYEQIISLGVKNAQVNFNLAFIYDQQGDTDRAISNYQDAITYQPDYSPAYSNLADILIKQERFTEAKNYLEQAIKINPVFAESYYNLGNVYLKLEQLPEAVKAYEQAIAVNPKLSAAHFNLANTYASLERPVEAIAAYRLAIAVNPQYAEAYNNLGNILRDREEWDEAIASYSQVVSLQPDFVGSVYTNLAVSLEARGSMSEALVYYRQSVKDAPKYAEAHLNLGMALLTIGKFTEGWQEYEWRSLTAQSVPREFPQPRWDGSDLTGKTILIHTEQGLGDAIMFIRYIDLVKARCGENSQIILECRPPVARLFQCLTAIDQIIIDGNPHPPYDVQIALMSLPLLFQTTLENIPCQVPYIQVNTPPLNLPNKSPTKLKIGIVWGANFQHSTSPKRSCPVSYFAGLANIPEVQLYSLQKGPQVADLAYYPEITNLDHLMNDLADTANIINQLDLVISVDTAVAHLAGALGKPTWLLLAFAPEWRWLLDRPDSPWYPTMRLFRQPEAKDWQTVFAQVSEALSDLINTSGYKVIKTKKRRSSALSTDIVAQNPPVAQNLPILKTNLTISSPPINQSVNQSTNQPAVNKPILPAKDPIKVNQINPVNQPVSPATIITHTSHTPNIPQPPVNHITNQLSAQNLFDQAYQVDQNGDLSQAIALYKQGLHIQPNALAYNNLGNIYKQQAKYQEAIASYEAGLKIDQTIAELYYNCGIAWQTLEQRQKAILQYEQAIKYKPEVPEFHVALALNLQAVGRIPEAIAIYQQVIQKQPTTARHYYNIGTAYQNSKLYAEAVTAYQKAIELAPQNTGAYNNLGNTFRSMGRLTEAIASYEQAMEIDPNFAKLYNNKGCTLLDLAQPHEAINCFRVALEKDPNYTEAHSNLGMTLLSTGEWQEGWREYEWRKKFPGYEPPPYPQPVWQGENLTGKTILLVPEQGFGDNIQFIRYVPELIAKGGRVMVQCYPALQRLWQQIPGIAQILLPSDPIPYFDYHINLMSLPYVCQTTLENIPRQIPYLNVPADLKIPLAMSSKSVNIGIVWATNPINTTAEKRSCPFSYFQQLLDFANIKLFSLQKETLSPEQQSLPIKDCSQLIRDFADTAAIMQQLDLIITVDTAAAHLAGALGIPVWTLLPFTCDWRWMRDRTDSPWYPTMRLFRQTKFDDWSSIFPKVLEALEEYLRSK